MMKRVLTILFFCSWAALSVQPLCAQQSFQPPADEFPEQDSGFDRVTRKSGSLFRRTAKNIPDLQLDYARELEAAGRWRKAARQYEALVHRWHQSEEAPIAQLSYARLLYEQGRYEKAFKEFQYLITFFPGLFDYSSVVDYQVRIANEIMTRRRLTFGLFPGFEAPELALPLLETVIANAPGDEKTPALRLRIGMIHEGNKDIEDAVKAYEAVIFYHPRHESARTARFRKAMCLVTLSDKSPRDERRCRDALSALVSFGNAYQQESDDLGDVRDALEKIRDRLQEMYLQRARYYDEIEKKPLAALISYREFIKQFPAAPQAADVKNRIEALENLIPPPSSENI